MSAVLLFLIWCACYLFGLTLILRLVLELEPIRDDDDDSGPAHGA